MLLFVLFIDILRIERGRNWGVLKSGCKIVVILILVVRRKVVVVCFCFIVYEILLECRIFWRRWRVVMGRL